MGRSVGLLLCTIAALLDAAERIASCRRESVTVTINGSPRRFRTALDALEVAEQMTSELRRALGEEAARGGSGDAAARDAVALLIERCPFRLDACEALRCELGRVRELVSRARAAREEAAARAPEGTAPSVGPPARSAASAAAGDAPRELVPAAPLARVRTGAGWK